MIGTFLSLLMLQGAAADSSYFQQGVAYRIEATLDDASSVLRGRAQLLYTNHSRTRLDTLYFHEHLNAFRPNSAWARRDLQFGNRRFQDLSAEQHAYSRLLSVTVDGRRVAPVYPGSPDSTIAAVALPSSLAAGGVATVLLDWEARLSTLPRRQGRRGRHHDFAQWYPRIATFGRGGWQLQALLPQGEFYGEFGDYDVTLDVAADQVLGATGVPVEGDPGWAGAAVWSGAPIEYQRTAYASRPAQPLGLLANAVAANRKRVRWRAEQVHHFAWTANPQYIYEQGKHRDVAIHVLYQPGDTAWANGVTVQRTAQALAYYDTLFGPYPYAQITNVHRIESGGTEFPMMVMDGSPGFGLILHEVGHQWMHGIFGNNEFVEGWLDEGFTSFTNSWYAEEEQGPGVWAGQMESIIELEQARRTQPLSLRSEAYVDFNTYNAMTYTKPALVLRMLRELVGEDVARRALKDFYQRNRFRHVTEADLKGAFERASGQDLGWFFQEWFHTTGQLDYSIAEVSATQQSDGTWRTRVEVRRTGDNFMPVTLLVGDTVRRLDTRERVQVVAIDTRIKPAQVVLDPQRVLIDIAPANNRKQVP